MGLDNLAYLAITILSTLGLLVSTYIFSKKQGKKAMTCPLNFRCDKVLFSKYSDFLGVPLEILGIFYYAFCIIGYTIILMWPEFRTPQFVVSLLLVSSLGFIFSLYLVSLQVIKLKELCSWCLSSAILSTGIFFLVIKTDSVIALSSMIKEYVSIVAFTYGSILLIGFIGSLAHEILFLYFYKDCHISTEEKDTLEKLNQIILLMLGGVTLFNFILPTSVLKVSILTILIISNLIHDLYKSTQAYSGLISLLFWTFLIAVEVL